MNSPRFVCPNDAALLRSFTGRAVAVRVGDVADIAAATANVRDVRERVVLRHRRDEPSL